MKRTFLIYTFILLVCGWGVFLTLKQGRSLNVTAPAAGTATPPSVQVPVVFSSFKDKLDAPLTRLFVQLIIILAVARIAGAAFTRIGQPAVVGEMFAGILLGPSLFGWVTPDLFQFVFSPASLPTLRLLSRIGVCIYMFVVGMEIDLSHVRRKAQTSLLVGHASIAFPFLLGVVAALFLFPKLGVPGTSFVGFALFIGISMSITAFPVLARILEERQLSKTSVGTVALTSAALGDVTAWIILAVIVAIVQSASPVGSLLTIGLVLAFVAFMVLVLRPLLQGWINRRQLAEDTPDKTLLTGVLALVLASALVTEIIGIHPLFGAFLAGTLMPQHGSFRELLRVRIEHFSSVFLLPLFFVFTGLRTQVDVIHGLDEWLICLGIIAVATVGKFGSTLFAARVMGVGWTESFMLGALMNTRGLMELIALNIGYDLGILSSNMFTMLVIMALTTTFLTGPLLTLAQWGKKETVPTGPAISPGH